MTDPTNKALQLRLKVMLPVLGAAVMFLSWPSVQKMVATWSNDPRYSHGFLVPLFSAYLLWTRKDSLKLGDAKPHWSGLLLIVAGEALRYAGSRFYIAWFEGIALIPELSGLALLVGGWPALRWAAPAIGFLIFMVPLPYSLERALGWPLQRVATLSSNYALQTCGIPSVAEGSIIALSEEKRINVVDACNGMGMMYMFLAFACATALVIRRPLLDRVLILLSAIPIALFANITRITVTGLLNVWMGERMADWVYHDVSGWLMMPIALGLLWLELVLLSHLLVEMEAVSVRPMPAGIPLVPGYDRRSKPTGKP